MPLLSLRRIHRLTHRTIATAVALSLLSMPVTYRGGADAAHPHTIFQLWEDVRIGSFTHHAPDDEADGHQAPDQVDARPGAESMGDGDEAGADVAVHHGAEARPMAPDRRVTIERGDAGAREPARGSPTGTGTGAVESDPDAPVASSAFTPSVRGTMLTLPSAPTLLVSESFSARVRAAAIGCVT